jgi:hypothetical protein
MKKTLTSGFMVMIYAILGLVLMAALFTPIMSSLASLLGTTGVATFTALVTVIGIIPTILLLGLSVASGIFYYKGYKQAVGQDPGGLLRMVLGILQIILFITMFATIVTSFYSLYTTYNSNTTYIAFGTVLSIVPTILFLGGIFSGGMVAFQGGKTAWSRRSKASKARKAKT